MDLTCMVGRLVFSVHLCLGGGGGGGGGARVCVRTWSRSVEQCGRNTWTDTT